MPRRRSGYGKKIDNLRWEVSSGSFLAFSAGEVAAGLISVTTLPETLMRIRGNISGFIDGASAPGKLAKITMGIIKVPEGTGTTVLWNPASDGDAPWVWWTGFHLGYEEYVTDVIDSPGMTSYRETIDNKAMRRTRPDEEYQIVAANSTEGSALTANLTWAVRTLVGF